VHRTGSRARRSCFRLALVAAVAALACKQPQPPASTRFVAAGDHALEIAHANAKRRVILRLPPDFATRGPLPVLIAYHGGASYARRLQKYAGLDAKADALGYVVIYPNGSARFGRRFQTWNAGACCGWAAEKKIDDVGFTLAILADLARDLLLDRTRVYATGHSNGAMMAYRLAADAAPRIAAIVPVAGADMTRDFAPAAPVPVLHVHSVDDPRALWAGGTGPPLFEGMKPIEHRSVEAGLLRWRERDGCRGAGTESDARSADGHTAAYIDYAPCADGTDVALWKLSGPGHGWPGSRSARMAKIAGPNTTVIAASDEVFRFVARFTRPDAPPLSTP
jgi:polyhydroxybutyrate depolymerase